MDTVEQTHAERVRVGLWGSEKAVIYDNTMSDISWTRCKRKQKEGKIFSSSPLLLNPAFFVFTLLPLP